VAYFLGHRVYTGWSKKSLPPNHQKIVLNRIKACQWD